MITQKQLYNEDLAQSVGIFPEERKAIDDAKELVNARNQ